MTNVNDYHLRHYREVVHTTDGHTYLPGWYWVDLKLRPHGPFGAPHEALAECFAVQRVAKPQESS